MKTLIEAIFLTIHTGLMIALVIHAKNYHRKLRDIASLLKELDKKIIEGEVDVESIKEILLTSINHTGEIRSI